MENEILEILRGIAPQNGIDMQTNLLEEVIDSLSLLILIEELENRYALEIPLDKLQMKDFENVRRIALFVQTVQNEHRAH